MSEGLGGLTVVAVGGWCCGGSGYLVEMLRRAFRQVRRPVPRADDSEVLRGREEEKNSRSMKRNFFGFQTHLRRLRDQ